MRSKRTTSFRLASLLSLALCGTFATACGSSASTPSASGATDATAQDADASPALPPAAAIAVTAAAGGTVTTTGASVSIPAGAMAADATITITPKDKSAFADAASIAGVVYELGPDGSKFTAPVKLALDLGGTPVPAGKEAFVAWYDGQKWVALADSQIVGSKVEASTGHFTLFAIVFMSKDQVAGGCAGATATYTGCGGDLVGTWKFDAACLDFNPGAEWATCQGAKFVLSVNYGGTVTFGGAPTNSMSMQATMKLNGSAYFPKSCLPAGKACADVVNPLKIEKYVATDTAQACGADFTTDKPDNQTATHTTSGNTFTVTPTGQDGKPDTFSYCVSGKTLTVVGSVGNGSKVRYTATRQ